jgi:hypothetical protein
MDPFSTHSPGLSDPASNAILITPDDATDIAVIPRCFVVSSPEAAIVPVKVTFLNDLTVILHVVTGQTQPYRVKRIHATDTAIGAGASIVGLW